MQRVLRAVGILDDAEVLFVVVGFADWERMHKISAY
jgi:hypothetical protein